MKTPHVGQIVHYQRGTEPQAILPAMVLQVLDTTKHRCSLHVFGSPYIEHVDCPYCESPKQGTWHYIPRVDAAPRIGRGKAPNTRSHIST